jgi:anti-sigma B factor antagonist
VVPVEHHDAVRLPAGRTVVTPHVPTGSPPDPSLAVSVDLASARVRVAGELDRDSAHHLLDAVGVLAAGASRHWQLDAGDVTFCDVGGMRALSSAHSLAAAHGRDLHLVRSCRPVDRMVELLGPERVFPTSPRRRRRQQLRCGATATG